MKTPDDLTDEEYEMLGFYNEEELEEVKHYASKVRHNDPLFVNANIDVLLHDNGVELSFSIWQYHGIVGGNKKYYFNKENMIHAFDFVWDCAQCDGHAKTNHLIDALLKAVKYGEPTS